MKKIGVLVLLSTILGCSTAKVETIISSSTFRIDAKGNCKLYPSEKGFIIKMKLRNYLNGKSIELIDSSRIEGCSMYSDTVLHYIKVNGSNVKLILAKKDEKIEIGKGPSVGCE